MLYPIPSDLNGTQTTAYVVMVCELLVRFSVVDVIPAKIHTTLFWIFHALRDSEG